MIPLHAISLMFFFLPDEAIATAKSGPTIDGERFSLDKRIKKRFK